MFLKRILIMCFIVPISFKGISQNLENIKAGNPVKINGFLSTNQVFNINSTDHKGIYSGYYTGNVNFDIYGVNIPLTFIYTNNKTNFSHPFNQYGLHPTYKWVRTHIGYATMTFSPYTLRGILFLGGGVELTPPGLVHFSAMYGRIQKAVNYDTANAQIQPAFRRMGYGFKFGVGKGKDVVDINFFQAADVPNSIVMLPDSLNIAPKQNTVVSLNVGKQLLEHVIFTGEYANSAITQDMRAENSFNKPAGFQPATWFMTPRSSTICRKAIKANISYVMKRFTIGTGYEHIDPDFTTFGAYYFTNNLENYTVNGSVNFLENKITISGNTGLQKDNISKNNMNSSNRVVGSLNVNVVPNERLNLNGSYSNFTSYTNVRSTFDYINQTSPYQNWDTLNYRQVSQNINGNASYQLSSNKEKRQTINLNLTYQTSTDKAGKDSSNLSQFYNVNASYMLGLVPQNMNITGTLSYNRNEVTEANSSTWGPSVTVSKMLLKKTLRTSLTYAYNTSYTGNLQTGDVMNFRFGTTYTLKKQHNFNLNLLYQLRERKSETAGTQNYHTTTITFSYIYNFSMFQKSTKGEKQTD